LKTTDTPTLQDFHIDGVKHINPIDALEALQNGDAVMIDIRELNEVKLESVPLDQVLNHPMSVILERLPYINKDQNIIVACSGGVRSSRVVSFLMQQGYENVASLDGGLHTWKAKGLPMTGISISAGCCCSSVTKPKSTILETKVTKNIDFKNVRII